MPEDAGAIAALNAAAWRRAFVGVVPAERLLRHDGNPSRRRSDLEHPIVDAIEIVWDEGDGAVGWLAAHPAEDIDLDPTKVFEVKACYVHPDYWRHGVARRMMQNLLERLRPTAWIDVVLWTPKETPQSHAFYIALGFALDGAEKEHDLDGPVPVVRFRRAVAAAF